jgi:hypothetical protein
MPAFVAYIARQIDTSDKKQVEIARDLGYQKPNIITMFKQGLTRVPMEKVPRLARSLGLDPAHMMNTYLAEYAPEIKSTLEEVYGLVLTRNERGWIELLRRMSRDGDPVPDERALKFTPADTGMSAAHALRTQGPLPDSSGASAVASEPRELGEAR